jgi:hypothetical protein
MLPSLMAWCEDTLWLRVIVLVLPREFFPSTAEHNFENCSPMAMANYHVMACKGVTPEQRWRLLLVRHNSHHMSPAHALILNHIITQTAGGLQ